MTEQDKADLAVLAKVVSNYRHYSLVDNLQDRQLWSDRADALQRIHDRLANPLPAEGVVVKALEWCEFPDEFMATSPCWTAETMFGRYAYGTDHNGQSYWHSPKSSSDTPSLIEAKAAAEADYSAQVRELIAELLMPFAALSSPLVEKAKEAGEGWQSMDTAPRDGKHCILAIKVGAFVYSAQGACHNGKWLSCISDEPVEPLAWMPNVLLPDHLTPWKTLTPQVKPTEGE